jgi:hypothetical protein
VGYLGFYESNDSDHRGLFVDVENSILDNKFELKRPPRQSIGFSSPAKIIYQYKQYIQKQFIIHRIYKRAEILHALSGIDPIAPGQIISLNNFDKQVTKIVLAAEKHICPVGTNVDFT